MGMAASQARLLTITARLSDNELRSQSINNAKMRLAAESAQASENYINALNDANLMFSNYDQTGLAQSQLLSYNSLMMYSSYNNQYGLVNASGQLLVSESEAAMFRLANGNLNAYLKSHGLEYTTTYFEEVGAIVNEDYPEPFNYIDIETLQKMYEAYGSYESSLELENYKTYFRNFVSASDTLSQSMRVVIPKFLTSTGEPQLSMVDGDVQFPYGGSSVAELYTSFMAAFKSPTNPYGLEYLKQHGYITEENYNYFKSILDSVKLVNTPGSDPNNPDVLSYTSDSMTLDNGGIYAETDSLTGNTTYYFDDISIVVDSNNNVVSCSPNGQYYEENTDGSQGSLIGTFTWGKTSGSLAEVINSLSVASPDGNLTSQYSATVDENGVLSINHRDLYKQKGLNLAKELFDGIASTIVSDLSYDEYFNIQKFTDDLLNGQAASLGVDLNMEVTEGVVLSDVLNNYNTAKEEYLKFISDEDWQAIEDLLNSGAVTAKDLYDIDFVLKMLKEYGLDMSENYKTVTNEFVIDNMISIYGEPKYAWIDENDTNNTGNADAKAQWFTNLFNRMTKGFKELENGLASSYKWLEYALESGIVSMEQVDKSFRWKSIDYKTCSNITEQTDNTAAIAKAEAEYTRAMNDIDAKDSRYDMELKNIDTEHSALQQEYEVIKGVISKNIERTFKFSQQG